MPINRMFTNRVRVYRRTLTDDGAGGDTQSWSVITKELRCRLWKPNKRLARLDSGDATQVDRRMAASKLTDVRPMDKIVDLDENITYFVFQSYSVRASKSVHHKEFDLVSDPRVIS